MKALCLAALLVLAACSAPQVPPGLCHTPEEPEEETDGGLGGTGQSQQPCPTEND